MKQAIQRAVIRNEILCNFLQSIQGSKGKCKVVPVLN